MSVNVDIADLLPYTYYSDDESRKIEGLIQKDIMLAEYKFRRRRMNGTLDSDPFILLDSQNIELVCLDQCEVDTLEISQLLSYIKARKEITLVESSDEVIVIIPIVFASLFATLLIVTALIPALLTNLVFVLVLLVLPILATSSGYFANRRLKSSMFFRRELIAAIIKENPTFLESLRLLAEKTKAKGWKRKEYRREIQYYERIISKLDS